MKIDNSLVKKRLKDLNIDRIELARRMGIHRNTLSNNITSENTTLSFVEELSNELKCDVSELLGLKSVNVGSNQAEIISKITIELYNLKSEVEKLEENNQFQYKRIEELKEKLSKYELVD